MVSSYNGAVSGLKLEINNGIFTDILLVKMFVFPHNTQQVRSLAASRRCRWRNQKFAKVMRVMTEHKAIHWKTNWVTPAF